MTWSVPCRTALGIRIRLSGLDEFATPRASRDSDLGKTVVPRWLRNIGERQFATGTVEPEHPVRSGRAGLGSPRGEHHGRQRHREARSVPFKSVIPADHPAGCMPGADGTNLRAAAASGCTRGPLAANRSDRDSVPGVAQCLHGVPHRTDLAGRLLGYGNDSRQTGPLPSVGSPALSILLANSRRELSGWMLGKIETAGKANP
jgi:hypothetical protein